MRTLKPQPLTHAAFAPFGNVIDAEKASGLPINYGAATRFDDLAEVDVSEGGGRVTVSLFRARRLPEPITIEIMERHPLGSQAFMPLDRLPFVVVVAPKGDLNPDSIAAFIARGGQGVNIGKGVWHHFLLALRDGSEFLVIDRVGPGDTLDEVRLSPAEQWRVEI